jgi:hypothetical protein
MILNTTSLNCRFNWRMRGMENERERRREVNYRKGSSGSERFSVSVEPGVMSTSLDKEALRRFSLVTDKTQAEHRKQNKRRRCKRLRTFQIRD